MISWRAEAEKRLEDGLSVDEVADQLELKKEFVKLCQKNVERKRRGEKRASPNSLFDYDSVVELRRRYREGESTYSIARHYGVSQGAVCAVITGINWPDVPGAMPLRPFADTVRRGSKVSWAKLDEDKVREIRKLREQGYSYNRLAAIYGVRSATIQQIFSGRSWRHVK